MAEGHDNAAAEHKPHESHKSHGSHGHGAGGGHAEGEHEGAPEWLISFADNVALLMGFFVILLAMNMKEPTTGGIGGKEAHGNDAASGKMLDMIISIREAFNNPVSLNSNDPKEAALVRRILQRKEGTAKDEGPPGDKADVQSIRPTDYFRIGGVVSFEEGKATIDSTGVKTNTEVAKQLKGRKSIVEIRGHASLAEASDATDKGMIISFQRALGVARSLRSGGLEWEQLRVVSCGVGDRAQPIARGTGESRTNQRVEIVVTDEQMPSDPYSLDPTPVGPATPATTAPAMSANEASNHAQAADHEDH